MKLEEVVKNVISRAGVIRVRNALNPLLWASLISSPICWTTAYFFREDQVLRYFFSGLGALPVIGTFIAYFVLLFRDPNRLQSEEFIIQQQELSIIERKGMPPMVLDGNETEDTLLVDIEAKEKASRGEKP